MGQRLPQTPALFIHLRSLWFPPSLPLLLPWQQCLCRTNLMCHPLSSSPSGKFTLNSPSACARCLYRRTYVTPHPLCHHVCSTLTITQSGQKRYKRGDPVISSWAHGWEQHVHLPAHGCAWHGGWAHLKHVRLSILFSLVESQECQYVWQWVCKVMVFLLGEESKKSSLFLLIVWAQGVYLLVDVIQWIFSDDVFAQRGSSREETV